MLNKSILALFSSRKREPSSRLLPRINRLRDWFAGGTSVCRGNAGFFSVALDRTIDTPDNGKRGY
jgi:hypothetical protein